METFTFNKRELALMLFSVMTFPDRSTEVIF